METPKARADGMTEEERRALERFRVDLEDGEMLDDNSAVVLVAAVDRLLAQLAERDAVIGRLRKVAVKASGVVKSECLDRRSTSHDLAASLAALQPGDLEAP